MTTIAITGNPVEGFSFYGPFDDHDDAEEWIIEHMTDSGVAWTAILVPAETDDQTAADIATLLATPVDDDYPIALDKLGDQ